MGGKSSPDNIETTAQLNSKQKVNIPSFLRPFLDQSAGTASGALSRLSGLSSGDLVADFNEDQVAAFELARQFGSSSPFTSALDAFLPTANGDFLFGGDGFNAAGDASVRAAQPHILSTFGRSGSGTGGLAQAAIGQAATDAFAQQFSQERTRQLQAASALPQLGLLPIDLLMQTGGLQQTQAQREIDAPIAAQTSLLNAALGGLPISSLLGSTQTGRSLTQEPLFENEGAGILGGALSGFGLAQAAGLPLLGPLGIGLGVAGSALGVL